MKLERFLLKPVEIEILGEMVPIKPLSTKYYPLLLRSQRSQMALFEKIKNKKEISDKEYDAKYELDMEIAFLVLSDTFPELTKEQFDNEIPERIIGPVIEAVFKASGLTDEDLEKASEVLKNFMNSDDGIGDSKKNKE